MLDGADIPRSWMPEVYESPEVSGRITSEAAGMVGLRAGTPVVGGAGDNAAGAVGNGVVETGMVSASIGTSGVVFAFADKPVVDPGLRVHTFCHAVPGKWHVMGVMLSAGGSRSLTEIRSRRANMRLREQQEARSTSFYQRRLRRSNQVAKV